MGLNLMAAVGLFLVSFDYGMRPHVLTIFSIAFLAYVNFVQWREYLHAAADRRIKELEQ